MRPPGLTLDGVTSWYLTRAKEVGGCLITEASLTRAGYGAVTFARRTYYLHRLVLQQKLGRLLVQGEVTRHTCHRPACINPEHLLVGTKSDNSQDMVRANRQESGEQKCQSKLSWETVSQIRKEYASGQYTMMGLAELYGVGVTAIHRAVHFVSWRHDF